VAPNGSAHASAAQQPHGDGGVIEEVIEVLRSVASLRTPDRALAVRYHSARTAILASRFKSFVPPYLLQCVSVFKFHDFINLFAADVARRVEFIDQTFVECRKATGFGRQYDVFGERD
jgi:hypothetical protein